ncbi:VOC family protein [Nocardia sp. NPDC004860]|uniref:VOC family protein n=1 Tax=Nocardia sp. NPDC004860 TaxID=3154557 RepID=UPI0033AD98B3
MTAYSSHSLIKSNGPAAGRLQGVNHLQLIVDDMDTSVRFYRDILGLRLVRTRTKDNYPVQKRGFNMLKNYFFDMGNGGLLSLLQIEAASGSAEDSEPAVTGVWLWPGERVARHPRKMDHLAFDVDSHEDMVWFREHLITNGVEVTKIITREDEHFVESIYFYDPNGIPLEIATFDRAHPRWQDHDPEMWFWDTDPVPALRSE